MDRRGCTWMIEWMDRGVDVTIGRVLPLLLTGQFLHYSRYPQHL